MDPTHKAGEPDAKEMAMENFIASVHAKDAKGAAEALKAFMDLSEPEA